MQRNRLIWKYHYKIQNTGTLPSCIKLAKKIFLFTSEVKGDLKNGFENPGRNVSELFSDRGPMSEIHNTLNISVVCSTEVPDIESKCRFVSLCHRSSQLFIMSSESFSKAKNIKWNLNEPRASLGYDH